jgi:hypothetical protein
MSGTTNAAIAAAFASVSFGAAAVVTRFVIGDIEPAPLAFLRYLIVSLLLASVVSFGSHKNRP